MTEKGKSLLPDPYTWKGTWRDDWRIMGQEGYLIGKHLQHRKFNRALCYDDFDQCDFCWVCFDQDTSCPMQAYFEPITRRWVCETCYADFQEYFHWTCEEVEE